MSIPSDELRLVHEQNKELRLELERRRLRCLELEDKCTELRATIGELLKKNKELEQKIGDDIYLFYDKTKRVIESQVGLGLTMKPIDLIKLWFHFLRSVELFRDQPLNQHVVYRLDQMAVGLAHQMYEREEIQVENLADMLERVVYPFITIEVGKEIITWKELRQRYHY